MGTFRYDDPERSSTEEGAAKDWTADAASGTVIDTYERKQEVDGIVSTR
jgi:hypothetical protein